MDEKELITTGLIWLSDNVDYRNDQVGGQNSKAVQYSDSLMRIIKRVKDFVENSPKNNYWLHNFLLGEKLHPDVFQIFFKIYSEGLAKRHSHNITEVIGVKLGENWIDMVNKLREY